MSNKEERIERVNQLLVYIGSCGRKFFYHDGRYARFFLNDKGRLKYENEYTLEIIDATSGTRPWGRKFTHGGTLQTLCKDLARYIRTGEPLTGGFGPWPSWIINGDPWAYGKSMPLVREEARRLGIFKMSGYEIIV